MESEVITIDSDDDETSTTTVEATHSKPNPISSSQSGKPPSKVSPFGVFQKEQRGKHSKTNNLSVRKLAELWHKLPEKEKEQYRARAKYETERIKRAWQKKKEDQPKTVAFNLFRSDKQRFYRALGHNESVIAQKIRDDWLACTPAVRQQYRIRAQRQDKKLEMARSKNTSSCSLTISNVTSLSSPAPVPSNLKLPKGISISRVSSSCGLSEATVRAMLPKGVQVVKKSAETPQPSFSKAKRSVGTRRSKASKWSTTRQEEFFKSIANGTLPLPPPPAQVLNSRKASSKEDDVEIASPLELVNLSGPFTPVSQLEGTINHHCRLCGELKTNGGMIKLADTPVIVDTIINHLNFLIDPVKEKEDGYPEAICVSCGRMLLTLSKFKKKTELGLCHVNEIVVLNKGDGNLTNGQGGDNEPEAVLPDIEFVDMLPELNHDNAAQDEENPGAEKESQTQQPTSSDDPLNGEAPSSMDTNHNAHGMDEAKTL